MEPELVHTPRDIEAMHPLSFERIPFLPNFSSHKASDNVYHKEIYEKQNLGSNVESSFHNNNTSLNVKQKTCEFPYTNTTSESSSTSFFKQSALVGGDSTAATTNVFYPDDPNSYYHMLHDSSIADSSYNSILPNIAIEAKPYDLSSSSRTEYRKKGKNKKHIARLKSLKKPEIVQSSSQPPNTSSGNGEDNEKNEFSCLVCRVDCGTAELFEEHKNGKQYICRACTAIFNDHQELESHFFSHRKFVCEFCNKCYHVKHDLIEHKNTEAECKNPTMLRCKICHNKFKYLKNFEIHMKNKHSDNSQPITCQICNTTVKTLASLTFHMKTKHSVYESMECDICHSILLGPDKLKHHIRAQHLKASAEACPICKKVFCSKAGVKSHLESHFGEEKVCNICGAVVKGRVAFNSHLFRHTRTSSSCTFCSLLFNSDAEKRKHYQEKHTVSKHVICETCGKEFVNKRVLEEHKKIHSNEKPHVCDVCGVAFRQKVALKTHSRVHTDLRKYCCDQCGKDFRWKQTFDKHMLKCKPNINEDTRKEKESE